MKSEAEKNTGQTMPDASGKFVNRPLPYAYNALEPYIDEKTMRLHHDRHLQTYVDNLNKALDMHPFLKGYSLEQLLCYGNVISDQLDAAIKNNAGGVYNHNFYFAGLMNPASQMPEGELAKAIDREFGSYAAFQKAFKEKALSVFGSGYAWLVTDGKGKLQIVTTANQDTPLSMGFCPILNIDVWEHAYYLKHYNVRADYIDDWFRIANWEWADQNYKRCLAAQC